MTTSATPVARPFNDGYLQAYSEEHLFYEIDMLFGVGELLSKQALVGAPTADDARRTANLLVEGFGIHLRNVIDFLYPERLRPTDVVASDFCAPGAWEPVRPPLTATLNTARFRANKELAHLTTDRQSGMPATKKWDAAALLAEIKPLLKLFASKARPTALSLRVGGLIQ